MSRLRVRGRSPRLRGACTVPGDKSIGHRALLVAALSDGLVEVRGLGGGEDNRRTREALVALGVRIDEVGPGAVDVHGRGLQLAPPPGPLDCGNSGTSIRLLCGVLAPQPFPSQLVGDRYLHARPMRRVAAPLAQMGAVIEGAPGRKPGELYPPLTVGGGAARLHGIDFVSQVASAQVKSAILLAALSADGPTTVTEPACSRDHSERMLRHAGAPLSVDGLTVAVDPRGWDRRLRCAALPVPADLSAAAFVLGAASLVAGSEVVVHAVGINPTRTGVLDALAAMGGTVEIVDARDQAGEPVADLRVRAAALRGMEIAGELTVRSIDELPLLAALAAHAAGPTTIADAAELRVKESDRVASTVAMLRAFGADAEERPDGLVVAGGGALHAGVVDSHGDHRIAMAAAVCALAVDGESEIRDTENVATSFPDFAATLARLGAEIY